MSEGVASPVRPDPAFEIRPVPHRVNRFIPVRRGGEQVSEVGGEQHGIYMHEIALTG